jgi:hypothetical protein
MSVLHMRAALAEHALRQAGEGNGSCLSGLQGIWANKEERREWKELTTALALKRRR